MKILIVNRFFGGAQIPTGRMAEDVARILVEEGHEVTALASTGTYAGAEKRGGDESRVTGGGWNAVAHSAESDTEPRHRNTASPKNRSTLRVEQVRVPKWMPRALAWLWFTWQARKRIPQMDWDVCVLMTDPPLLPLLAARVKAAGVSVGQCFGRAVEDKRPNYRAESARQREAQPRATTETPPNHATRRVAVWLMDLYPEALAASGRITKSNPLYRWYFDKRQRALAACDLLVCLGEAQRERLETKRPRDEKPSGNMSLTQCVRTAVVPPWDDRGNIAPATDESLQNLALYAGNLGEAHCFEEILAAAPYLPADWTIRFAARGAKLSALKEKAKGISHRLTRIDTDGSDRHAPPGRGEELVPDDLGTRNSPSDKEAAEPEGEGVFSHSRPQGDRQLGELSEAVKLTRINTDSFSAGDTGGKSLPWEITAKSGAVVHVSVYASEEETPKLLASARVHLITMSPGWEGVVVPSKLYGCIRTGRPVLFIGPEDADTAREIRANDWGKILPPGASGEEVAAAILELAARETCVVRPQQGAGAVAKLIQTLATAEQSETKNSKS